LKAVTAWGDEGKKLFMSQRNVYLNSSLAQDAGKKLLKLKFPERKAVLPLRDAAVAVLRKNSKLNPPRVK
jgi:hypothetical protein